MGLVLLWACRNRDSHASLQGLPHSSHFCFRPAPSQWITSGTSVLEVSKNVHCAGVPVAIFNMIFSCPMMTHDFHLPIICICKEKWQDADWKASREGLDSLISPWRVPWVWGRCRRNTLLGSAPAGWKECETSPAQDTCTWWNTGACRKRPVQLTI